MVSDFFYSAGYDATHTYATIIDWQIFQKFLIGKKK